MTKTGSTFERLRPGLKALLLLVLFPWANTAFADRMVFHNIFQNNKKMEHQLSGINHIVQDGQGFIWFGSEKGLARYDGVDTRIYRHDPIDPDSLAHDFIRGLLIDQQGVMWIATELGLCYYRFEQDRFTCNDSKVEGSWPRERVRAIAVEQDNSLLFGTATGLYRISGDRKQISQIRLKLPAVQALGAIGIATIAVDANNVAWVGTDEHGLFSVDLLNGSIRHFQADPARADTLVYNRISSLAFDRGNRLWVGTFGGGISVLDAQRTRFQNYSFQDNKPGTLSSNIIWDIFTDSKGTVWMAVDQGGLVRFDEHRGFVATRHKPYDATSLISDQVRSIFEDNNGDLWVGAFPSGVSFYNRSTGRVQSFKHEPDNARSLSHSAILTIHQDAKANIWIGTEDGLNLFDPAQGTFTRYQFGRGTALTAKAVLSIAQYDDNTLWVGTWSGGLLAFDLISRTFRAIDTSRLSDTGKNSQFIWDIMRDRKGDMWIATEFEGVGLYDRAQGRFRFFSHDLKNPNSLHSNFAWAVLEDSRGAVWMATNSGLAVLQPGASAPSRIPRTSAGTDGVQADRITALYEDRRGRVWIGSQDNGVFVFHPSTGFQHLGSAQGLPPGASSGFIEDHQGAVWILTTNGLVRADGENFELQVFGTENGLAGNSFNRNAAWLIPGKLLYLGSSDGLSIFNPVELNGDRRKFPVWITRLRILNEEPKVGAPGSPLPQAINFTKKLTFDRRSTMFSFDFAALDYRHGQDTRYAYRLDGFDRGWMQIGTNRSATYTNIPAGVYTFQVKASHGNREWTEPTDLRIVIPSSPWQSWWAYTGYTLALLALGYLVFHYVQLRGNTRLYKNLSATDMLTGVSNRLGITQAAKLLLGTQPHSLYFVFIDIDHFKRINDTRGHDSGDRVLVEVAEVLRQCVRRSDLVGRWGGEEFLMILLHVDEATGLQLAESVRHKVAERVFDPGQSPLKVTLSLGCAMSKPGEGFEAAVKRADQALYQAKNAGRNCTVVAP